MNLKDLAARIETIAKQARKLANEPTHNPHSNPFYDDRQAEIAKLGDLATDLHELQLAIEHELYFGRHEVYFGGNQ